MRKIDPFLISTEREFVFELSNKLKGKTAFPEKFLTHGSTQAKDFLFRAVFFLPSFYYIFDILPDLVWLLFCYQLTLT